MSSNEPWELTDIASVILRPILLIGYAVYSFRLVRGGWGHLEFLAGEPLVALMIFLGVIAAGLALIPFLFLGQHFNRKHRKAFDFTLLQIPLILTVILWVGLYLWSIFDAWREAATNVAS